MSDFTKEKVDKLAELLMIGLTDAENKMVLDEFDIIDKSINKINMIEGIENIKPMTHALDNFAFELREDVAVDSDKIEDLLSNCDYKTEREVEVPKVVEE